MLKNNRLTLIRIIISSLLAIELLWIFLGSFSFFSTSSSCGEDIIPADPKAGFSGIAIAIALFLLLAQNIRLIRANSLTKSSRWYMKLWVQAVIIILIPIFYLILIAIVFRHLFDGWCY